MNRKNLAVILLMQALVLSVTGCKNFTPDPKPDNYDPTTKEGPGLFSGEKGYFELDLER